MSNKVHYIAMGGTYGCLPDNCAALPTLTGAVEELATIYELGSARQRTLRRNRYLDLDNGRDGGDYCEIVECDCGDMECHNDTP